MVSPTFDFPGDFKLSIDLAYEAEKLLVPSPPYYHYDPSNGSHTLISGMDPNVNLFQSYIQSFHDAPNGLDEELHEIIHKYGAEVRINGPNQLVVAFRNGYFNEHKTKGNRKLLTTGFSLGYWGFEISMSQFYSVQNSMDRHDWFLQLGFTHLFKS